MLRREGEGSRKAFAPEPVSLLGEGCIRREGL
jgi:hypothetical protein